MRDTATKDHFGILVKRRSLVGVRRRHRTIFGRPEQRLNPRHQTHDFATCVEDPRTARTAGKVGSDLHPSATIARQRRLSMATDNALRQNVKLALRMADPP